MHRPVPFRPGARAARFVCLGLAALCGIILLRSLAGPLPPPRTPRTTTARPALDDATRRQWMRLRELDHQIALGHAETMPQPSPEPPGALRRRVLIRRLAKVAAQRVAVTGHLEALDGGVAPACGVAPLDPLARACDALALRRIRRQAGTPSAYSERPNARCRSTPATTPLERWPPCTSCHTTAPPQSGSSFPAPTSGPPSCWTRACSTPHGERDRWHG